MSCTNNWKCKFPEHLEKMLKILEDSEEKKQLENYLEKLTIWCNSNMVGKTFHCFGQLINITCPCSEIECCPRFPSCHIVKGRQTMFKDDLSRLSIETCTSLGTGKCSAMMENDAQIIFDGGNNITVSRPVKEKFKGL